MPEAHDSAIAWRWLLERKPGTRGAVEDALVPVATAAHAHPGLRRFYPFPTHGTLRFLRCPPPLAAPHADNLPFILYGGPPYKVYAALYAALLGEAATADDAVSLVLANLPADLVSDGGPPADSARVAEAGFRLLEFRAGITHVAEVAIRAEVANRNEILLSLNMFAWRRDAYGPNATVQMEGDEALIREAIDGVQDGLDRVGNDNGIGYRVTVTKIRDSAVDTSSGDVRAAARQALYAALGVQPEPAPRGKVVEP